MGSRSERAYSAPLTRKSMSSRNPKWTEDEVTLALDLYFGSFSEKSWDANSTEVIELSEILNRLAIHDSGDKNAKFRNPNGVALKLSNLAHFDPKRGEGMSRGSKTDEEIWNRYSEDRITLSEMASKIRLAGDNLPEDYADSGTNEDDEVLELEGGVLFRRHRYLERNRSNRAKKIKSVLKKTGKISCEVCGIEPHVKYELDKILIECHHKIPLKDLPQATKPKLSDLALLCPNCHRAIHRIEDCSDLDELRGRLGRSIETPLTRP